jgi:hypothetical protein
MQVRRPLPFLLLLPFVASTFVLSGCEPEIPEKEIIRLTAIGEEEAPPEPVIDSFGIPIDSLSTVTERVRRNETLSAILSRHNVSHQTIARVAQASREVFGGRMNIPTARPGQSWPMTWNDRKPCAGGSIYCALRKPHVPGKYDSCPQSAVNSVQAISFRWRRMALYFANA